VWPLESECLDEPRETVRIVGQAEGLGWIHRASASGSVPRHDRGLIRERFELPAPFAMIGEASVEQDERRPISGPLERDRQPCDVDLLHRRVILVSSAKPQAGFVAVVASAAIRNQK